MTTVELKQQLCPCSPISTPLCPEDQRDTQSKVRKDRPLTTLVSGYYKAIKTSEIKQRYSRLTILSGVIGTEEDTEKLGYFGSKY